MEALTPDAEEESEGSKSTPASRPEAPPAPPPDLTGPPAAEEAPVTKFVGAYRFAGGVAEQRVLWGKIESIANTFNFIAKPIVRDRLAAGNVIHKEIRIEADANTLAIHTGKSHISAPLDGSTIKHKSSDGATMDMTFAVGDKLVQTFKGNGRSRVNTYEVDGNKLTVHTKIQAAQLPKELVYTLTYERIDAPADGAAPAAPPSK